MHSMAFYQNTTFVIPRYPNIQATPFSIDSPRRPLAPSPSSLEGVPPTYNSHFLEEFEHIAGAENLFPIFI